MAIKLTDRLWQTRNQTQWGPGVTNTAPGEDDELCSPGFIHFYPHDCSELAYIMDTRFGRFGDEAVVWAFTPGGTTITVSVDGLKAGCRLGTTLHIIDTHPPTPLQRARSAVSTALEVCFDPGFQVWGKEWVSGGRSPGGFSSDVQAAWARWGKVADGRGREGIRRLLWQAVWMATRKPKPIELATPPYLAETWAVWTACVTDLLALGLESGELSVWHAEVLDMAAWMAQIAAGSGVPVSKLESIAQSLCATE